ncbi:MAG TPA: trigger factor [Actinomycetota bacterium]|nr:trigger factor [Actinomycetota bacterium]
MKTSVAQIGQNKFKLTVQVPPEDVSKMLDRTYKRLAGEIRVPGFRPGKAPKPIIDQRLGAEFVRSEALKDAIPELFQEAVLESDLDIVSPPSIDVTSFESGGELVFDATVETRPTPELREYVGLKVARPDSAVTDEEVQEQLERLRVRLSPVEVVERPALEGDFTLIDLTTTRDGEVVDDVSAKDLLIELGAGMVVPELDSELAGKSRGDILDVPVTLPERFGDRAGWDVRMQVLVKDVKARKLLPLDDDFAKTASEFDTLEELSSDIRKRIEEIKTQQADAAFRERVVEAFLEHGVSVDLPEGMVEMEVDAMVENLARSLNARGASLRQYLEAENIDFESAKARLRPGAERSITLRLGLDALAAAEGLEATEDDRAKEVELLSQRLGAEPDDLRSRLDQGSNWASVDGDIIRAKALDFLIARAEITTEVQPP